MSLAGRQSGMGGPGGGGGGAGGGGMGGQPARHPRELSVWGLAPSPPGPPHGGTELLPHLTSSAQGPPAATRSPVPEASG